jgi:hypothetical protein
LRGPNHEKSGRLKPLEAMKPLNIKRILYFAKDGERVLSPAGFRHRYGLEPHGVNFYYGANGAAVRHLKERGTALSPYHRAFFDMVQATLIEGGGRDLMVNLGLWPYEPGDPYGFVDRNPELVGRLAEELNGYQERAHSRGKRLEIVVRYASEMNDPFKPAQPWGRPLLKYEPRFARPFRESFPRVREIFRARAPGVRFAFSPAIRADITGERYEMIAGFWPGDAHVDIVSCTWYVGQAAHLPTALRALERYVGDWAGRRLPFGIDELGGIDGERGNDPVLERMFAGLAGVKAHGGALQLEYATTFLHGKWAADATLAFLRPSP